MVVRLSFVGPGRAPGDCAGICLAWQNCFAGQYAASTRGPIESNIMRKIAELRRGGAAWIAVFLLCLAGASANSQEKYAEVYGFRIHYSEAGTGDPLILLHGLWGGSNEWQPVIASLSRTNRVIAMDFIGFHNSDKPETQYHNALLAQFLAGFIEKLDLENVTLMGHAMGANAATYTAYHYPQRVRALVLVDGAGYRSPERDLSRPPSQGMLEFIRTATGSTLASTRGLLERRVNDKSLVTDQWVSEAYDMWLHSARAIGDMLREGGDLSDEQMRAINVPVLVVWGSDDNVFNPDNAQRLHSDIAASQVKIIEGAGHLPQVERTNEFLAAVQPFLSQTGSK